MSLSLLAMGRSVAMAARQSMRSSLPAWLAISACAAPPYAARSCAGLNALATSRRGGNGLGGAVSSASVAVTIATWTSPPRRNRANAIRKG